jgi:hypothetical protein
MFTRQVRGHLDELHPHQFQAAPFKTANNLTNQPALYTVGFHQN